MRDYFKRPAVFYGAQTKPGLNIGMEILQFIGVYILASIAECIVLIPELVFMILTNKRLVQSIYYKERNTYYYYYTKMMQTDLFIILEIVATGAMIVAVILYCKTVQKRNKTSLGFRKKNAVKEYLTGMAVGFLLFSIAVLFCVVTGAIQITDITASGVWGYIILYFLAFMIQGMAEEVLLRGYFMVSIARRYSLPVAVITNSIMFAALHLWNNGISVLAFINLVLFGVFASIYFIKHGNIWGVAALHSIWNFTQGNLYGIKVSGMRINSSIFSSTVNSKLSFLNGGAFGLEGGLGVTVALGIGIVLIHFLLKEDIDCNEIEQEKAKAIPGLQQEMQKKMWKNAYWYAYRQSNANYGPNQNWNQNQNYGPDMNYRANPNCGQNQNWNQNQNYGPNQNWNQVPSNPQNQAYIQNQAQYQNQNQSQNNEPHKPQQ